MRAFLFALCWIGLVAPGVWAQSTSSTPHASPLAPLANPYEPAPAITNGQWSMPDSVDNVHVETVFSSQDASIYAIGVRKAVPLHRHRMHTETIVVLEGEGWMRMGADSVLLKPGHMVVVPRMTVHGVRTTSAEPLRVWSIQAPEFKGKDREWVRP